MGYALRNLGFSFALVCLAVVGSGSPAHAQKNTAVANVFATLPGEMAAVATASIAKGKAKRVLVANVTVTAVSTPDFYSYCDLTLLLQANGITMGNLPMLPFNATTTCDCNPTECIGCTLSATTSLDLDAAETANPGTFKGQPIDVVLQVRSAGTCEERGGLATVVVQMLKK